MAAIAAKASWKYRQDECIAVSASSFVKQHQVQKVSSHPLMDQRETKILSVKKATPSLTK
jgi:hypothetical protein